MFNITDDLINAVNNQPGITELRNSWDYYKFNDYGIPRVSNILDKCISKGYLINWAAGLGSIDRYKEIKFQALDTGSLAHEMIEDYLANGYIANEYKMGKYANEIEANNAYWNYREFENDLHNKGYDLQALMMELVCAGPLYGGTIDLVSNIINNNTLDNKLYILDFKTSNKIAIEYLLQTMLYVMNIEYLKSKGDEFFSNFNIGGIGIIRVDKKRKRSYQYLFVDFEKDKEFTESIRETAYNMILWYYEIMSYETQFKKYNNLLTNREALF